MSVPNNSIATADVTMPAATNLKSAALIALGAIIVILLGYGQTTWSMISTWERSQTFAHGFLIFPISGYLIWGHRKSLAMLQAKPNPWALPVLGVLGFGWLLGSLASVQVFQQYCVVAMIPITVWAILGNAVAWTIAFPLAYLLLAVPFGEIFIPRMIDLTADFTIQALQWTGIPVFREGNSFMIPSGSWSVIEACSGLRYLIASFTLGTLYAYITYTSLRRRLVFIAFSIIVPIAANGIRAYMIVMIGHLSGMRLAVGVDHLIYGWIFFGFVMLLLFWIGTYWREDTCPAGASQMPGSASAMPPTSFKNIAAIAGACIAVSFIWPVFANYLDTRSANTSVAAIEVAGVPGLWDVSDISADQAMQWSPHYVGDPSQFRQIYQHAGHAVHVIITYYRNQRHGSELIEYGNVLVPEGDKMWRNVKDDRRSISLGAEPFLVHQNQVISSQPKLLVWRWYWLDGKNTESPYLAKYILAKNKLLGKHDDGAEIIIASEYEDKPGDAVPVLQAFLDDMMPHITKGLGDAASR